MKFTLVRHGAVEEPRPGLAEIGHDDAALSAFGRRQAAALAGELMNAQDRGEQIVALYTSPLRSARTTAEALSAVLDAGDPVVAPELATLTPEVLPEEDMSAAEALQERAWSFILALKQDLEPRATVVLVTHELVIRAVVCKALEMPLTDLFRFELDLASLTTIEFRVQRDRERTLVAALNDTCHVEAV